MSEDILIRVEKFERAVALCLCSIPALFSLQCIGVAVAMPIFREMFGDFGAPLPAFTELVVRFRMLWLLIGIMVPIICILVARRGSPVRSVVISTVAGLSVFFLAQLLTFGLFIPILQLGSVAK